MSINSRLAAAEAKAARLRALADASGCKPLNVNGMVFARDDAGAVTINGDAVSTDDATLLSAWFKAASKADRSAAKAE